MPVSWGIGMKLLRKLLAAGSVAAVGAFAASGSFAQEGPSEESKSPSEYSMDEVREIHDFFSVPANRTSLLDASKPQSAFVWQNMTRFFPTAEVARGGSISTLPRDFDPSLWTIPVKQNGETSTVQERFESTAYNALIVIKGGSIALERYKSLGPSDKHVWFSSGKVVSSTLLAILEAEGKVDVTQPVSSYLEELEGSVWDTVTVEQALDMASGLDGTEHDEPLRDSRSNPQQIWFKWAASIGIFPDLLNEKPEPWAVLRSMERRKPGHTAFEYNSINTFVVERIVERIEGKPLNQVFSERIWSKIGAEHGSNVVVSPQGYPLFLGFHSATLRDMARFGMIFTPSWEQISEEQIIAEQALATIQFGGRREIFAGGNFSREFYAVVMPDEVMTNRYQWDVVFEDGDMYKQGVAGQGLYVSPSRDLVAAWYCTGCGDPIVMAREIARKYDKE